MARLHDKKSVSGAVGAYRERKKLTFGTKLLRILMIHPLDCIPKTPEFRVGKMRSKRPTIFQIFIGKFGGRG